jgi:2Fe-2S ferredoxin
MALTVSCKRMVKIRIENMGQKEVVAKDAGRTLLAYLLESRTDWMHACGGKGRCTTCRAVITRGGDQLQPETVAERKFREQGLLREDERLCCQAVALGNVAIRVPRDCQFPHIRYDL